MRGGIIIITVAGFLTAALLGVAWMEHLAARAALAALAAADQRQTALAAEIRQMEEWQLALENGGTARGSSLGPNTPAAVSERKKSAPAAPRPNATDLVLKDPKLQMLYLAAARASRMMTYGPLFVALRLSPAQKERFMDISMKQEQADADLLAVMRAQGLPADDPAVAALKQQTADEAKAAQLELLGPEAYRQVQEYHRTLAFRFMVGQFAGVAAWAGIPLDRQQAERMTQSLADASSSYRRGGSVDYLSIDWDAADQRAAENLTPAQRDLYQTTELLGEGISRRSGRVFELIDQAKKADAAAAATARYQSPGG
jgi:hypothetical protein